MCEFFFCNYSYFQVAHDKYSLYQSFATGQYYNYAYEIWQTESSDNVFKLNVLTSDCYV